MQALQGKSNGFELTVWCNGTTHHCYYENHLMKVWLVVDLMGYGITEEAAKLFADTVILSEHPIVLSLGAIKHTMYTKNGCVIELKDVSNRTFTFHEN